MEIKIEKATSRDLTHILEIEKLSFPYPWNKEIIEPMLINFSVVKNQQKRIIGFISLETILDETHILHMAVHPDFRRQKVASKMVEFALNNNSKKCVLEVRKSNQAARELYEKFGFKEVLERKKYYQENGEDALVLIYEKF